MANVVTTASTVSCGHGAGKVTLTSGAKLKVGNDPVVLGIVDATVVGCVPPSTNDVPCTTATATATFAAKLRVGQQKVLLEPVQGTTKGTVGGVTPQTLLAARPGPPTKLQAS